MNSHRNRDTTKLSLLYLVYWSKGKIWRQYLSSAELSILFLMQAVSMIACCALLTRVNITHSNVSLGCLCVISILLIFRSYGQNRFNLVSLCTSTSIFAGGHQKDPLISRNNSKSNSNFNSKSNSNFNSKSNSKSNSKPNTNSNPQIGLKISGGRGAGPPAPLSWIRHWKRCYVASQGANK